MSKMRFRSSNRWLLALGVLLGGISLSWAQGRPETVVVKAIKHVLAPPLSQMVPIPPRSGRLSSPPDDDRLPMHAPRATSPIQDSVLQGPLNTIPTSGLSTLSTNSGVNVLGMGNGFPGYSQQGAVPDTNGAVGPTQFVQWINESFAVFNKSDGSVAYGPAAGNTLFQALGGSCAALDNLDSIVQFDKLANRWVMMMPMFRAPFLLCVAISTTADATNGGWNLYSFPVPGRLFPDYPKVGIWPDGYYVTYNQGNNSGFVGAAACALDRNSMLAGATATMQCFTNISVAYGGLLPADLDGTTPPPVNSPEYFLNFDYSNNQSLDLWQFHVDWTTPTNSTFAGPTNIPVAAFTEACGETALNLMYTTGACIPQAGTTQGLDSYGDRVMYRLAYRNFADHQSLLVNHTVSTGVSSGNTGIRWYELQNTSGSFGLYQQGTYAPDSSYRWMGGIAMDKLGDIGLFYSVSDSTMSPSIRYTGRVPTDPLGQMENEIDVLSNVPHGSQTSSYHWGDYSSMVIDSADDCTFWFTTEYQPTDGNHWSTRIASFSFPSCTTTTQNTLTVSEVGQGTVTSTDSQINCTNGSGTCSAVYPSGSSVTLNATAASSWTFSGWSGSCSGGSPCNLTLNSNLSPTATFTTQNYTLAVSEVGQGTVASIDGKINCTNGGGTCSAVYQNGSSVTMNAIAASGWAFSGWSGSCSGGSPCTLAMNSNLSPTATFLRQNYTLTVNEVGQGTVTSTDSVINCTNGSGTCSAVYQGNSLVRLNAIAARGWTFSGWSGSCSGVNPCRLVMNSNLGATATFTRLNYMLTLNEVGQGTVTSTDSVINCTNGSGACSAAYPSGSPVTLNATAAIGWAFSGWSGSCSGVNPCRLVMNSNLGATATFTRLNYMLTLNEVGQGTVTSTDSVINCTNGSGACSAAYPSGSLVTLNATAAIGWTFSGWSGPCSGGNPCNVVMNSNLSPAATFTTATGWAIVNKTSNGGSPITSLTIPATGAGHLIAVAMMMNGGASVASVTDNASGSSNTYVSAGARATNLAGSTEIWYAVNSISGATVVTLTFVGSPTRVQITAWEVSGVSSLAPDATNISSGRVVLNNTPGPAVTTTQAGDFILSVLYGSGATFPSISNGNEFTDDFRTFGNGWAHITSNTSSAGTHQASWYSSAPAGGYCASTVAFLSAH